MKIIFNMNKVACVFILTNLFLSLSLAQEVKNTKYLYKVTKDSIGGLETYAYTNSKDEIIVPFGKYPHVFTDTIKTIGFVTKFKKGIWAINLEGKELYEVVPFDNGPDYLSEGLFRILSKDHNIGFANEQGMIVIKPKYPFVDPFYKGVARFCLECPKGMFFHSLDSTNKMPKNKGRFGMIDLSGEIIIPAIYETIYVVDNMIRATKGTKEYFFDFTGKEILQ